MLPPALCRRDAPPRPLCPRLLGTILNMAPDTPAALSTPPPPEAPPPLRDKVRIRFRKDRDLRLLSHHDLMRTFERMLRRSELPFRRTQGFHPHPRIIFALSLPLGVVGCDEVVELELDEPLPLDEIQDRLRRQAPPGLHIGTVHRIDFRAGAQVRRLCYRIAVPAESVPAVQERIAAIMAAGECLVERKRPPVRRVDLRPWLSELRLVSRESEALAEPLASSSAGASPSPHASPFPRACSSPLAAPSEHALEMALWLLPSGTARPDEVLQAVGLFELLDAGVVLERAWLELHDEITPVDSSSASSEAVRDVSPLPRTRGRGVGGEGVEPRNTDRFQPPHPNPSPPSTGERGLPDRRSE